VAPLFKREPEEKKREDEEEVIHPCLPSNRGGGGKKKRKKVVSTAGRQSSPGKGGKRQRRSGFPFLLHPQKGGGEEEKQPVSSSERLVKTTAKSKKEDKDLQFLPALRGKEKSRPPKRILEGRKSKMSIPTRSVGEGGTTFAINLIKTAPGGGGKDGPIFSFPRRGGGGKGVARLSCSSPLGRRLYTEEEKGGELNEANPLFS